MTEIRSCQGRQGSRAPHAPRARRRRRARTGVVVRGRNRLGDSLAVELRLRALRARAGGRLDAGDASSSRFAAATAATRVADGRVLHLSFHGATVAAGLAVEFPVEGLGIEPTARNAPVLAARVTWNYTAALSAPSSSARPPCLCG